jgi:large subunit ribosomal protein L25
VIDAVRSWSALGRGPEPHRPDEEFAVPEVKLTAESRTEFGKGAARRLRRAHKIPAVLYGHGTDPVHVALPGHATMLALKHSNTLLTLDLGNGTTQLALPKDVQRNPVRGEIEHVDLVLVRRGEKVTVDIPVHVTGEPAGDGLATLESPTLSVEVEATAIPQAISVSVEGAEEGSQVHAGQIALPAGARLAGDPDAIVVVIATAGAADTGEEAAPEGDVVEEPADETAGEG